MHTVNKGGFSRIGFRCFSTLYFIPFVFNVDILNLSMKIMPLLKTYKKLINFYVSFLLHRVCFHTE